MIDIDLLFDVLVRSCVCRPRGFQQISDDIRIESSVFEKKLVQMAGIVQIDLTVAVGAFEIRR